MENHSETTTNNTIPEEILERLAALEAAHQTALERVAELEARVLELEKSKKVTKKTKKIKKKKRKISGYNVFLGQKIKELRAEDSDLKGGAAMKAAAKIWRTLDDDEKDALVEIVAGFGGTRYTPYMGKRYHNASADVYATDATRQEIMSELTALAFTGEKIMIQTTQGNTSN